LVSEAPEVWGEIGELCRAHDVAVVYGMFGTVGEDYTTLESIRRTGGVVPDATWEQSLTRIRAAADVAQALEQVIVGTGDVKLAGILHHPQNPWLQRQHQRHRRAGPGPQTAGLQPA
jgi:hypothetical protein